MIPILDVPLIDLAFARAGRSEFGPRFVNVSGQSPGLREHLSRQHPEAGVLDEGDEPLGQAATLRALLPRFTDTVVTYNCDLVSDLDLGRLVQHHKACRRPCTVAVKAVDRGADLAATEEGVILIDRRIEDRAGYLFLGAACFDRALLNGIPPTQPLGLVAGLLGQAIGNREVELFEHRGYAFDTGTPARYLSVSMLAAGQAIRLSPGPPGSCSENGWYLGPGASAEHASLLAGAVVLAGARVEPGARLENCIVLPGQAVPAGTRLRYGIWFDGKRLPAGPEDPLRT